MANVFKSMEIYKRLKNVSATNNPLRAVRGVYVVGYLSIPKYTPSGICINHITSNDANITDLEKVYAFAYQDEASASVVDVDKPVVTVTQYTNDYQNAYQDEASASIADIDKPVVTATPYVTTSDTAYQDEASASVADIDNVTINVTQLSQIRCGVTPDSTSRIRSITSTLATITNVGG